VKSGQGEPDQPNQWLWACDDEDTTFNTGCSTDGGMDEDIDSEASNTNSDTESEPSYTDSHTSDTASKASDTESDTDSEASDTDSLTVYTSDAYCESHRKKASINLTF